MPVLIDSNIILDIITCDPQWYEWSLNTLSFWGEQEPLAINPVIYGEVSVHFDRIEDLEQVLPENGFPFVRLPLPYEATFLAGKCFLQYRQRGGLRTVPVPDFYIGAHAAVSGLRLMTRDARRYASYFPTVELIAP